MNDQGAQVSAMSPEPASGPTTLLVQDGLRSLLLGLTNDC